jgi:hypothetical protein
VIYSSAYDHHDAISASSGAILWSYTPQPPQLTGDLALRAVANRALFIRDGSANQNIEAELGSAGTCASIGGGSAPIEPGTAGRLLGDCRTDRKSANRRPGRTRKSTRPPIGAGATLAQPYGSRHLKRRGWDSNPRMTLTAIAGFQDRISGQRTM